MTEPEVMLWSRLRRRLGDGLIFRRQHAFGPYILDFFCPLARLAIEVDGVQHAELARQAHDRRRDEWLAAQGLCVYRIAASAVFRDLGEVAAAVRTIALERARKVRGERPA